MTIYNLPVGWRLHKVGEVADLVSGGTPSRKQPDYFKGNIPWITGYDILETEPILQSARECITQEAIENSATNLIPKGQVLLTTRVTVGKVAITGFDVCINQDIQGVVCGEDVLPGYIYYFLLSQRERMVALQRGTTIKGIPKGVVQSLEIPLPPLPVQRHIVYILERADELRRKRAQANTLAERISLALFIKMFGDPATNPMGWSQVSISSLVVDSRNGLSRRRKHVQNTGYIVLRIRDVQQGQIDLSEPNRIPMSEEEFSKYRLEKDDLIFVRLNGNLALVGKCAIFSLDRNDVAFNDHLIRFRFDRQRVDPLYILHLLASPYGRAQIENRAVTTAGQFSIGARRLGQIPIPLPPLTRQRQFSEMCQHIELRRQQQTQSTATLDILFQNLLPRAFRGELTADLTLQEAFGLTERQMALLRILSGAAQIREPVLVTSAMKYTFLFQVEGTQAGQLIEQAVAEPRAPYVTESAYDFVPYKYGPFAKELYNDLEALEASRLVRTERPSKDKGALREKTEIYLVQGQTDAIRDLVDSLPLKVRQAVDAVIGQYGDLSQKQLLDLVYQRYPEYAVNSELRQE
jgi:type I restriction enzyme S subunit